MNSSLQNIPQTTCYKTNKHKGFSNSRIGGRQWMTSEVDDENKTPSIKISFIIPSRVINLNY